MVVRVPARCQRRPASSPSADRLRSRGHIALPSVVPATLAAARSRGSSPEDEAGRAGPGEHAGMDGSGFGGTRSRTAPQSRPGPRASDVGLLVAAAMAPETFSPSLSRRSALDQGLVTGLATGLHYLLSVGTQDALAVAGHALPGRAGARGHGGCGLPRGTRSLAVQRAMPPRPGERPVRGAARQAVWRLGATGLSGALLAGAEAGVRALDARLGAGGRLASIPLALPVGACVSAVLARQRRRPEGGGASGPRTTRASTVASSAVAAGLVAASTATGYVEYVGRSGWATGWRRSSPDRRRSGGWPGTGPSSRRSAWGSPRCGAGRCSASRPGPRRWCR